MTGPCREEPAVHIRALGPVEVTVGGEPAPRELLWRKNLALLVYLARSPRRTRSRAHLLGLLWAEKPEAAARHSLNEALRVLRREGGESLVASEGEHIVASPDLLRMDTDLLEERLTAGDPEGAAELVAGVFLEGFEVPDSSGFEDWLAAERMLWRRRAVEALAAASEVHLDRGDVAAGRAAAERAADLDPRSNAAVRAVMRAATLAGERAAALERLQAFRDRLQSELDVEPEPETLRLADRIRRERIWRAPAGRGEGKREEREPERRRTPLVGRDAELEAALSAWRRAAGRHGAGRRAPRGEAVALVLEGEPGVGKSRLAEELLGRARLEGAVSLAIRAVPSDRDAPWSGALALCRAGLADAPGLLAAAPSALAAIATELPEWRERFAEESAGAEPAPLPRALSELLRAVADEQPVAVFVDDAEWLDPESGRATVGLLRDLADAPFLLVVATAGWPFRQEWDDLRSRLGSDVQGRTLALEPLAFPALRALAAHFLTDYDDEALDRVARRVKADSAGLPLLATELLDAIRLGLELKQGGHGAGRGRPWPDPTRTLDHTLPGELPDAVVAAIRIGYRRLGEEARAVLAAAAILGERVDAPRLERATGLPPETVAEALDELEWSRWLVAEPRGYSFLARIVREAVARDMLTPGQRNRILAAAES